MAEQRTISVSHTEPEIDTQSAQAFFQPKVELDDEERKFQELAAKERRHEIGTEVERFEMPSSEGEHRIQSLQQCRRAFGRTGSSHDTRVGSTWKEGKPCRELKAQRFLVYLGPFFTSMHSLFPTPTGSQVRAVTQSSSNINSSACQWRSLACSKLV